MHSPINEQTNDTAIVVVVLARSIGIKEAQSNALVAITFFEIHDLNFVNPLGNSIIVVLDNGVLQRYFLAKDVCVFVTIDLGGASKYKLKTLLALPFQNVAHADYVG